MKFETVVTSLHLINTSPLPKEWTERWNESSGDFSPGHGDFLSPSRIREYAELLKMPKDILNACLESAALFREVPAARRLAVHCQYLIHQGEGEQPPDTSGWPMIPRSVHPRAEMFYAHIFLASLPRAFFLAEKRGIDKEVVTDTLHDIELWIRDYKSKTGRWGLSQLGWFSNHFSGKLYQLGRLQFQPKQFSPNFHFFRNLRDHSIIALAGEGMFFREDGQFYDVDDTKDPSPWTARFRRKKDAVQGYPLSPKGAALKKPTELSLSEWQPVLERGDPVLDVHIPASGPLIPKECFSSYKRAVPFFRETFPELKPKAFTCSSWLMDSQLEEHLPPSSNIVRFQAGYYRLPLPGANDFQTLERVFNGKPVDDLNRAPRDTKLQKAVLDHMKRGGRWRMALGVLFPEDI